MTRTGPFPRTAFTLIELLLALALIVVATSLIGSLMSLYARSFSTRGDDIRRRQLARSILTMIADDIRSVVTQQSFDASAIAQSYGPDLSDPSIAIATGAKSGAPESPTTEVTLPTSLSSSLQSSLPPGLYGNQNQLMIDVSRIPRADEYLTQQASLGSMTDVPADVKRVTYFLQSATPLGVQDSMAQVSTTNSSASAGTNSGLIRRQLDRTISAFAEESGLSNQLMTTGDLIAPEVAWMQFAFFDGTYWTAQWNSAQQGLPQLIQVTLGLQSATAADADAINSGGSMLTLGQSEQAGLGLEVYELTVAIPGAQLQSASAYSVDSADMESLGL